MTAAENNFLFAPLPFILGAATIGGTAWTTYDIYDTYQQEGPEAALRKTGVELAITAATAGAGKVVVKMGGKLYPSVEAAWKAYAKSNPALTEVIAKSSQYLGKAKSKYNKGGSKKPTQMSAQPTCCSNLRENQYHQSVLDNNDDFCATG